MMTLTCLMLAPSFAEYLKENLALTVILGVLLVLIVALLIALIVLAVKGKKERAAAQAEGETVTEPVAEEGEKPLPEEAQTQTAEEAERTAEAEEPAEETSLPEEIPAPAEQPEPVYNEPEEEKTEEEPAPQAPAEETPVKEAPKKAPVKKTVKADPARKTAKAPASGTAYGGKWLITKGQGGFNFELRASNGELMLKSARTYASLSSVKGGIETYKKYIAQDSFTFEQAKSGDDLFRLVDSRGNILTVSANYESRSRCESAWDSTKRFAATATVKVVEEE